MVHRWLSSIQREKVIDEKEEMIDMAMVEMDFLDLEVEVADLLNVMNVAREVTLLEIVVTDVTVEDGETVHEAEVDQEIDVEIEVGIVAVEDVIEAEISLAISLETSQEIEVEIVAIREVEDQEAGL